MCTLHDSGKPTEGGVEYSSRAFNLDLTCVSPSQKEQAKFMFAGAWKSAALYFKQSLPLLRHETLFMEAQQEGHSEVHIGVLDCLGKVVYIFIYVHTCTRQGHLKSGN